MALTDLPVEIFDSIIDLAIPNFWNNSGHRHLVFKQRLVCKLFDKTVSYFAFRKLDGRFLNYWMIPSCVVKWLLVTKIGVERNTPFGSLTAALRRAARSMVYWKVCHSKSSVCEEEYWDTVCAVAVGYQGLDWARQQLKSSFDDLSGRWACQQLNDSFDDPSGLSSRQTDGPTQHDALPTHYDALPVAAYLGDLSTVETLLKKGADVNASNDCLGYALYAAVLGGQINIVSFLLEHGANPSIEGILGTPLLKAVSDHDRQMTRLFLSRHNIDPNFKSSYGQIPLLLAARTGDLAITQLLLKRDDIQPNLSNDAGESSLWWAAKRKHMTIVQLLLERQDIVLNPKDTREIFHSAIANGYETTLGLLMERDDVESNLESSFDYPLLVATFYGREKMLRLLLERYHVKLDETLGGSLLCRAAYHGHVAIVRLLLARNDVNPNLQQNYGGTPLSKAAYHGHVAVVRLLLARNNVDPNIKSHNDRTPLHEAAKKGHEAIVRLLLARSDVNPNLQDDYRWTPLCDAVYRGRVVVIRLLLTRSDLNPNLQDDCGKTALYKAANWGHEVTVRLLLQRDDVDPNIADCNGTTPLMRARQLRHDKVVQLLLKEKDAVGRELSEESGGAVEAVQGEDGNMDPASNSQVEIRCEETGGVEG